VRQPGSDARTVLPLVVPWDDSPLLPLLGQDEERNADVSIPPIEKILFNEESLPLQFGVLRRRAITLSPFLPQSSVHDSREGQLDAPDTFANP